ncbi:hypothetical protein PMIN02_005178 [Paraphaeosphaeria minitans]
MKIRASGNAPNDIKPLPSENPMSEGTQRAKRLEKESPFRSSKHPAPVRSRADSHAVAPITRFRPQAPSAPVRPSHAWRTTAARFNAIFDAIPSNAASARRENPKRYIQRRHRAPVELGLIERELVAAPDTPQGARIMEKLDWLEEKMERARWEAGQRGTEGDEGVGDVSARKVGVERVMAGPHCVNDARVKLPPVCGKRGGKGGVVVYEPAVNRGRRGGKGRAVE